MKVLVTGVSGFIGGAIASCLVENGYDVVGIGRACNVSNDLFRYIQIDIASPVFVESLSTTESPCDMIVHAAAKIDYDNSNREISLTNCLGVQQLLELSRIWKVKKFVYLSSLPVIGVPLCLPVTENHPVKPLTAYHASKLYGEHLVKIASLADRDNVIFRLTSPVGYGMPQNKIFSVFVENALCNRPIMLKGKGERRQNYIDVRAIAGIVMRCSQIPIKGLFNLGGKENISNLELARLCINVFHSSSDILFSGCEDPDETLNWDVSIRKLERTIENYPRYAIEDSIRYVGDAFCI